jgi:hypothetical protein
MKKFTAETDLNINIFFSKIAMYLSLVLHKGISSNDVQEKSSALKREHPALQNPEQLT